MKHIVFKLNDVIMIFIGNEAEKHAIALAYFPTDNSSKLDVGLLRRSITKDIGVVVTVKKADERLSLGEKPTIRSCRSTRWML